MWFERFVIIVTSIHRDFLPSSWSMFYPTWVDIGVFIGTLGIFFAFYLAFARYFPTLAMAELKSILKISGQSYKDGTAPGFDDHGGGDHGHDEPAAEHNNDNTSADASTEEE